MKRAPQPANSRKVYRLDPNRRLPLLVAAGIFLLAAFAFPSLLVLGSLFKQFSLASLLTSVILILFTLSPGAFLLYIANHIRLVTAPEGIVYHQIGYSIQTAWDNIERIGQVSAGQQVVEDLILRQPALRAAQGWAWNARLGKQDRIIPLTIFLWWWRESELGQDLKRYAPHLFEQINKKPSRDGTKRLRAGVTGFPHTRGGGPL